jgi:LysM repeat protein
MKHLILALIAVLMIVGVLGQPLTVQAADTGYYVQHGDTLFSIAAKFRVSISELATINGIYDVNTIYVGQYLKIPAAIAPPAPPVYQAPRPVYTPPVPSTGYYTTVVTYVYHRVRHGEYLEQIAGWYGVSVHDLLAANPLPNPSLLYVGMRLAIPRYTTKYVPPPPRYQGRFHIVQYGENLFLIAHRYGRDVYAIARANNILNLNHIYAGMALVIP